MSTASTAWKSNPAPGGGGGTRTGGSVGLFCLSLACRTAAEAASSGTGLLDRVAVASSPSAPAAAAAVSKSLSELILLN